MEVLRVQVAPSWLSVGQSPDKSVFVRADGLRVHAVANARGSIAGKPGAVLIHGFHSDSGELGRLAAALADHGWAALRLDLRGCGISEGHRDDINGSVHDVQAGVDHLLKSGAEPDHVFLVGHSLGGAVAISAGVADPRVAGVVALHPSATYDLGALDPPDDHPDVCRPIDSIASLSPRPVLIIAGEQDRVLPCSSAEDLYRAALEPKRMLEVKDGTHAIEDTEAYALGWLLAGAPHV
jgi:pimeloyl-ACP methyl ester carboxylesterase